MRHEVLAILARLHVSQPDLTCADRAGGAVSVSVLCEVFVLPAPDSLCRSGQATVVDILPDHCCPRLFFARLAYRP